MGPFQSMVKGRITKRALKAQHYWEGSGFNVPPAASEHEVGKLSRDVCNNERARGL